MITVILKTTSHSVTCLPVFCGRTKRTTLHIPSQAIRFYLSAFLRCSSCHKSSIDVCFIDQYSISVLFQTAFCLPNEALNRPLKTTTYVRRSKVWKAFTGTAFFSASPPLFGLGFLRVWEPALHWKHDLTSTKAHKCVEIFLNIFF